MLEICRGDQVYCHRCDEFHELDIHPNVPTTYYLWVKCNGETRLGAIGQRIVVVGGPEIEHEHACKRKQRRPANAVPEG